MSGEGEDKPKEIKINKWDGSAVKNALDDFIRDIFINKLNYKENFKLVDRKLVICSIAVGFAMFAVLWDYLYKFPASKSVMLPCISMYFIMMGFFIIYTIYVENGIFLIGIRDSSSSGADPAVTLEASSSMDCFDDIYVLSLKLSKGSVNSKSSRFEKSVALFFDNDGVLLEDLLEIEVLKIYSNITTGKKEN